MRRARWSWMWVWVAGVASCAESTSSTPPAAVRRWTCPDGWVAAEHGGCGPAAVLCAREGGAAAGACAALTTPSRVTRLDDGRLDGPWPTAGASGGPPSATWSPAGVPEADWSPVTGIAQCPAGWAALPDGTCDPQLRTDCPDGSEALPGGACTATATCAEGPYADVRAEAMSDPVVRVRPDADASTADGTEAHPFATIAAAMARVGPRAWVLLAAGTYPESVRAAGDVHVVGPCAGRAVIAPTDVDAPAVLVDGAANALELRGLTVRGGRIGVSVTNGGRAALREAVVTRSTFACVVADQAETRLRVTDSVVSVCQPLADRTMGHGVLVQRGATALIERAHVAFASGRALDLRGLHDEVRDVVVRDTGMSYSTTAVAPVSPWYSVGISIAIDPGAVVQRAVVLRAANIGLLVSDDGTAATVEDLRVVDTRRHTGEPMAQPGAGVGMQSASRLDARRVAVLRSESAGVWAIRGARASLRELVVTGTTPTGDSGLRRGVGMLVADRAHVDVANARFVDNTSSGVDAALTGAEVTLTDTLVARSRPYAPTRWGLGVEAFDGGHATLQRVRVEGMHLIAVVAQGSGSALDMDQSLVRDTAPLPSPPLGAAGVACRQGATLHMARSRVTDNFGTGIGCDDGLTPDSPEGYVPAPASIVVEDSVIARTSARTDVEGALHDFVGQAMTVQGASHATLRRALVVDNARFGVTSISEGTTLEVSDSALRGNGADPDPLHVITSYALTSRNGGAIDAQRVLVADNTVTLAVASAAAGPTTPSRVTLRDSVVRGTLATSGSASGQGAQVSQGALLRMERVLLSGNHTAGASVFNAGSRLELVDSAVVSTQYGLIDDVVAAGVGLLASDHGQLDARGVVVADSRQVGIWSNDGATFAVDDVIVWGVSPVIDGTRRVLGTGAIAQTGSRLAGRRLAVIDARGIGLGAVRESADDASLTMSSSVTVEDLYVRGVGAEEIRARAQPGPRVSYGLHAAAGCALTATHAVVEGAEWGFFQSSSALTLRDSVIARLSRGAGASNGASEQFPLVVDEVSEVDVAGPVARDIALPVALLPSPPPP